MKGSGPALTSPVVISDRLAQTIRGQIPGFRIVHADLNNSAAHGLWHLTGPTETSLIVNVRAYSGYEHMAMIDWGADGWRPTVLGS